MRSCARPLLALLLAAPPCAAAPAAVPPALEARVAAAVAASWRVPEAAVRLEWPRATLPDSLAADAAVRLAGAGRDGWQVVRLGPAAASRALRVRAGVAESAWVAARPLAAGTRLDAGDLRRAERVRWGGPAAGDAEAPGAGWEVRRALAAGEALDRPAVAPPVLVAAGDPVRLLWNQDGVSVSLAGAALHAARRGETVRARVEGRAGTLTGTVTGPGTAVLRTGGDR